MRSFWFGLAGGLVAVAIVAGVFVAVMGARARSPSPRVDRAYLLSEIDVYEREVYKRLVPYERVGGIDWGLVRVRFESWSEQHRELRAYVDWCRTEAPIPYVARDDCLYPRFMRQTDLIDQYLAAR